MKEIPPEVDEKIIAYWYAGHQRPYIVKETGTSAGHIHDVIEGRSSAWVGDL